MIAQQRRVSFRSVDAYDPDAVDVPAYDSVLLNEHGIFTSATLKAAVQQLASEPWLVDGLIRAQSIVLLAGDSGLGKTPLAILLGLCVAAGVPFFGRPVQQGRVLYCDAESDQPGFSEMVDQISQFLGLSEWPADFIVWNPYWITGGSDSTLSAQLHEKVAAMQPKMVIVDPQRVFWPQAEKHSSDTAKDLTMPLRKQGADVGCTWIVIHHLRKDAARKDGEQPISLADNPYAWFQNVAGSRALVNLSDTRLGVEPGEKQADLVLAGFVRRLGAIVPMELTRARDEHGEPIGYQLLTGIERLNTTDRSVFDGLASRFRFGAVKAAYSDSGSNAKRFIEKCISVKILSKNGKEYLKAGGSGLRGLRGLKERKDQ